MSNKTIDALMKGKLPKDYILNISKSDTGMSINVSAAAKALELITEIVSES